MCNLNENVPYNSGCCKTVMGYKVVAKRLSDDTYHSIAMGFEYPKIGTWGDIPIIKEQNRIGRYFHETILISSAYKSNMSGRTAVFKSVKHAKNLLFTMWYDCPLGYTFVVVKVLLRNDLLGGTYGLSLRKVVAGRQMKIVCEIK